MHSLGSIISKKKLNCHTPTFTTLKLPFKNKDFSAPTYCASSKIHNCKYSM